MGREYMDKWTKANDRWVSVYGHKGQSGHFTKIPYKYQKADKPL